MSKGSSNLVELHDDGKGGFLMRVVHGAQAWESSDPDTSRIWWSNVGVNQNLAHAVHPDPISGVHCWLQKVKSIRKADADDKVGDLFVDTNCSMQVYREWLAMTRLPRTKSAQMVRVDLIGWHAHSNQRRKRINYRSKKPGMFNSLYRKESPLQLNPKRVSYPKRNGEFIYKCHSLS